MSDLGPYIDISKPRRDGTLNITQSFPQRLRPEKFPATLPIYSQPVAGPLTEAELRLIAERARQNYVALRLAKYGPDDGGPSATTWADLVQIKRSGFDHEALSEETKVGYERTYAHIVADLDGPPDLAPAVITESALIRWLRSTGIALNYVRHYRTCLRALLDVAVKEGVRPASLKVELKLPRSKKAYTRLWTQEDVDVLSAHCADRGFESIGLLIETFWEIGQRLGDLRFMRYGADYHPDGYFWFRTNKTDAPVLIQAPPGLRARLDARYKTGALMFPGPDGRAWKAGYLSIRFRRLKDELAQYKGQIIRLSHLRHSVVVELARANCTIAEIASITRHTMPTVYQVLHHYLPADFILARQAQKKREVMRLDGMNADIVVEEQRRVYIGDRPQALQPLKLTAPEKRGSDEAQ